MQEYRVRLDGTRAPAENPGRGTETVPRYLSLAETYGLEDEMEIGESSGTSQSVEQEFQSYAMAPLSSKNVDLLKFWEVGTNAM